LYVFFVPGPYVMYFLLLWHNVTCSCWKCC